MAVNGVYRTSGFWLRNAPSRLRHSSRLRGAGEDAHRNHPLSAPPTTAEAPPQFPAASTGGYVTRQAAFLAAYRKTSSIAAAAKAAGIKPAQHYRRLAASPAYWEAFRELQDDVTRRLQDKVVELAIEGWADNGK